MILTTTESIKGYTIVENKGLVKGNSVRAKNVGRDIIAMFKNLFGGEIEEYTSLLTASREQAIERMIKDAQSKNANAIIGLRFMTSQVMQGAAEILAYGTAVVIKPDSEIEN